MSFIIFLYVTSFVPLLSPNPGDATVVDTTIITVHIAANIESKEIKRKL